MNIELITDFTDTSFKNAFCQYFNEFGIMITEDDELFASMNDGKNQALVIKNNQEIIAFLQFRFDEFTHWFFVEKICFIREFWVSSQFRGGQIGSSLLTQIEKLTKENDIYKLILTTDSADKFYLTNGFSLNKSYTAKNEDLVYTKNIDM